jgi:oligopeptide/dipeptide ABC transporter ATP-binding protein
MDRRGNSNGAGEPLLRIENLTVRFDTPAGEVHAAEGVSLRVPAGGTVALVGESGCGKSVTAMALTRLLPEPPARYVGGRVLFDGADTLSLPRSDLLALRGGQIAYVFQEPATALNPVLTVGWQVEEAIRRHRPSLDARAEAIRWFGLVGLPDPERSPRLYPHEMSGGMRQRAMMAMALAGHPRLLIADEPTTALDTTIQAQVLERLAGLQRELGMAVLFITHNLGIVAGVADFLYVMYAGRIVESGPVVEALARPAHPYTAGLLSAVPRLGADAGESSVRGIGGGVPDLVRPPPGCRFAPRCDRCRDRCRTEEPPMAERPGDRAARCWFPLEAA